jgi:hypothetical protein
MQAERLSYNKEFRMKNHLLLILITVHAQLSASAAEEKFFQEVTVMMKQKKQEQDSITEQITTLSQELAPYDSIPNYSWTEKPLSLRAQCILYFSGMVGNNDFNACEHLLPADTLCDITRRATAQSLFNTMHSTFLEVYGDNNHALSTSVMQYHAEKTDMYYTALCRAALSGAKPESKDILTVLLNRIYRLNYKKSPIKDDCYQACRFMMDESLVQPLDIEDQPNPLFMNNGRRTSLE